MGGWAAEFGYPHFLVTGPRSLGGASLLKLLGSPVFVLKAAADLLGRE